MKKSAGVEGLQAASHLKAPLDFSLRFVQECLICGLLAPNVRGQIPKTAKLSHNPESMRQVGDRSPWKDIVRPRFEGVCSHGFGIVSLETAFLFVSIISFKLLRKFGDRINLVARDRKC
eukprot:GABV01001173.1.p3 GENE.GABV01001173.1~~GABV01001173.1.p3  ORF type:complete len:119 (+),score=9.67 GABV01001173.1:447-803(+)